MKLIEDIEVFEQPNSKIIIKYNNMESLFTRNDTEGEDELGEVGGKIFQRLKKYILGRRQKYSNISKILRFFEGKQTNIHP